MTFKRDIQLFENLPAGVSITNPQGKIIDANQALVDIFGYANKDDLLKTPVIDLYYDKTDRIKLIKELEKGPIKNFMMRGVRRNRSLIWLSLSSNPVYSEDGSLEYVDIIEDITRQVEDREKIIQYSRLFEESLNEIYIFDAETLKFVEVNQAAQKNLGYSHEELSNLTPLDIKPEYNIKSFREFVFPLVSGQNDKLMFNTHHQRKDNSLYPVEVHLQLSVYNNRKTFTAIILDISERENVEKALKLSEEKYKAIVEDQTEYVFRWKPDGTRTFVNKAYAEYYNKPVDELVGTSIMPTIKPKAWHKLKEQINQLTPENPVSINEHKSEYNGQTIWKEWTDRALFDKDGKNFEIQSTGRDITERKKTEAELRENQSLLRATLESTGEGILVVSNEGRVTHSNSVFLKQWKIPEELIERKEDKLLLDYVLDQLKNPEEFLNKVKLLYKSKEFDFDIIDFKDGRKFKRNSYPLIIDNLVEGRVWGFYDITEQFSAEEQLKESEAKFKQLVESLPDAIFVSELGGRNMGKILDVNKAAEFQTGFSRNELLHKSIGMDLLESFNENKFYKDEEKLLKHGILRLTEKKRRKNGAIYWVEVLITTIHLNGKKVALSVNRDITELKNSEQALKESKKDLLMIYDNVGVALFRIGFDKEGRFIILSANNSFMQITGRKMEDLVNQNISNTLNHESAQIAIDKYNQAIRTKKTVSWEETKIHPTGPKIGSLSATPVFDENGNCTSLICVIHDITEKKEIEAKIFKSQEELEKLVQTRTTDLEKSRKAAMNLLQDSNEQRKRAEEAFIKLKESNAEIRKLSQAVEQNPAAVIIIDIHGFIEYVNPFYTEKTGFTMDEVTGTNPKTLVF